MKKPTPSEEDIAAAELLANKIADCGAEATVPARCRRKVSSEAAEAAAKRLPNSPEAGAGSIH